MSERLATGVMTATSAILVGLGAVLLFLPQETLATLMTDPAEGSVTAISLLAASLLGLGVAGWRYRLAPLDGAGRILVFAYQVHFAVGLAVLLRHALERTPPTALWVLLGLYAAETALLSLILFRGIRRDRDVA